VLLFAGLLVLAVLALGGLAGWHAWGVKRSADTAQRHLGDALDSLDEGEVGPARKDVAAARTAVDAARAHAHAWPLDLVGHLPGIGSAVDDARALTDALDSADQVAESGLELYPLVDGSSSTLLRGQEVDLRALQRIVDRAHEVGDHLDDAMASLEEVRGDAPFVGSALADARDRARDRLEPAAEGYAAAEPVLDVLPGVLGADGPRRYLLCMLNPAELRYSGGATLNWSPMVVDDGTITLGRSYSNRDFAHDPFHTWKKVAGNPFHGKGPQRLVNATFNPDWSVSGEELLRGWRQQVGGRYDGVIAIDLPALAKLMRITGPVEVAGYGTLTGDNLVHELTGSYDRFASQEERHQLNAALIPVFKAQLFGTSQLQDKITSLRSSGHQRHFATYFRDPAVQAAFEGLGMSGELSLGTQDYAGVFSQNLNGSKVDVFQRRTVDQHVVLDDAGDAQVTLRITVENGAPPYRGEGADPRSGYFTRWNDSRVGVLLPARASLTGVTVDGEPQDRSLRVAEGFGYVAADLLLPPGDTGTVVVRYTVPGAAVADGDGLTYRLGLDPQGLVVPQTSSVRVTWPDGYAVDTLPDGWTGDGAGTARWEDRLTESTVLEITATR